MTRSRSHQCGKVRFRDHREAITPLHTAVAVRKRAVDELQPTRRREVRTYECHVCHGFHLTSMAA